MCLVASSECWVGIRANRGAFSPATSLIIPNKSIKSAISLVGAIKAITMIKVIPIKCVYNLFGELLIESISWLNKVIDTLNSILFI